MAEEDHKPLVTVVTPTYNMGDRIERCITSVRSQTYPRVEHLVIDGGSTDATVAVLERYADLTWVSERDRGQTDAINKGLRRARGDIIGWLNADDELLPDAIERVVATFVEHPKAGLVYGDIEEVQAGVPRRQAPVKGFSLEEFAFGNGISQPGTFWTRWAQEQVGVLDESFHLTMDFEYWLRFAVAGIPTVYVAEVLARFEIHAGSKTGSTEKLAFVQEEARALMKHGEIHGAAMVIDRWYWEDVVLRVAQAARLGDSSVAASLAREALPRMHAVRSRTRWFLWLARFLPRVAALVHRGVKG